MKKVLGIATLLSVISLITVLYLTYAGKAEVSSFYIQSSIFLLITTLTLVGSYAVQAFCPDATKTSKMLIFGIGSVMAIAGALTAYNIIDFIASINWVISLGIVFLLLVQLQLVGWGSKSGSITKIASLLIIISNLFLAVFFITKLDYAELELWIHIAVLSSLIAFVLGLLMVAKQKPSTKSPS